MDQLKVYSKKLFFMKSGLEPVEIEILTKN